LSRAAPLLLLRLKSFKSKEPCIVLFLLTSNPPLASDLRSAGFTAAQMKDAGCSCLQLKDAGFSAVQSRGANFNLADLGPPKQKTSLC
jgi:hypothetical protein